MKVLKMGRVGEIATFSMITIFALSVSATQSMRGGQGHLLCCLDMPRGGDGLKTVDAGTLSSTKNNSAHPEEDGDPNNLLTSTSTNKKKKGRVFLFPFRRRKRQPGISGKKAHKQMRKHTTAITNKMNEKLEEARRIFLDRMAAVSVRLINQEHDATMESDAFFQMVGDDEDITPQSNLLLPNRSIYVVTTAALPWRTGTAVNPLLRAAYLSRRAKEINNQTSFVQSGENHNCTYDVPPQQMVTLVVPWLELEEDRLELYGRDRLFADMQEQECYIREWLRSDAGMGDVADAVTGLRIIFYPARYHPGLKSIFAMGDICAALQNATGGDSLADAACILEEPEHLNWYRHPGEGWTKVFGYVVGIVHTNYVEYAGTQFHGLWTAPAIQVMSSAMIRAYCHKVIKLSGVLQSYAPEKESIENVHGVREDFIAEGERRALSSITKRLPLDEGVEGQVYYIGKILWAKGFEQMLELEEFYHDCTGLYFAIDVYGGGPEEGEIKRAFHGRRNGKDRRESGRGSKDESESEDESESDLEGLQSLSREYIAKKLRSIKLSPPEFEIPKTLHEWRRRAIPANFLGPVDHASLGNKYKVFVNPSISEVLCTTTFEALAMGKFAIIPYHESNKFFMQFPNCLTYKDKWEFAANLRWALTHDPEPLTPELAKQFTWEAATDRLVHASAITRREARERMMLGKAKLDERIAFFHRELGKGAKGDTLRKFLGAGPKIGHQVRYELAKQGLDREGSENEGLTQKFKSSSFVKAIKSSLNAIGSQDGPAYFTT
ncbi:hypothetical protein ACHAWF_015906 [Thalassiosira exigua]